MGGAKFAKNIVGLTMVFCFLGEFSYSKKDTTTKPKYENSPKNLGKTCEFSYTQCELYKDFEARGEWKSRYILRKKKSRISPYLDVAKVAIILLVVEGPTVLYILFLVPLFFPNPQQHANNIPPKSV